MKTIDTKMHRYLYDIIYINNDFNASIVSWTVKQLNIFRAIKSIDNPWANLIVYVPYMPLIITSLVGER